MNSIRILLLTLSLLLSSVFCNSGLGQTRWVYEYAEAFLRGLKAEEFVPGINVCIFNIARAERHLSYSNKFLSKYNAEWPTDLKGWEDAYFNVSMTVATQVPYAIYYCYALPEKAEKAWLSQLSKFISFKDFEYAFMQNILGNILSYMDAYEKSAHASANGEYLMVVEELGRAIYRSLIFDSMLAEGDDGTIFYH